MPTQKLRVTKKQAIMKEIRKTNPELPEVYIRRELYKVTNKDYQQKDIFYTCSLYYPMLYTDNIELSHVL